MGTKISYKGNQVGSGNSSGAETIVDKTSLPSSGIENVIYRVTDSVSGETSYHAGNETEAETEQLAKYSDIQIIQAETIPSAGASHVGKIYQYIGATNLSYTNGYFYKCVSDGESTPSYSWEEVQVQKIDDITPHWTGTQAEYAIAASGIEDGTIVNITDDYQEGVEVVDVVEEDNEGVPTSAAVYEAIADITPIDAVTNGSMKPVTSNAVYDAITDTNPYRNWTVLWSSTGHLDYLDVDGDEQGFIAGRIMNGIVYLCIYDDTDRDLNNVLPAAFRTTAEPFVSVGGLVHFNVDSWSDGGVQGRLAINVTNGRVVTRNPLGSYGNVLASYPL